MSSPRSDGTSPGGRRGSRRSGFRICVSVAAPLEDLPRRLDRVGAADLAEVRLDAVDDPTSCSAARLEAIVGDSPVPVLFTCRPVWEGGGFDGDEGERRRLLRRAAAAGARYVDVEAEADWADDAVEEFPCPVVLSRHWHAPSPEDLDAVAGRMAAIGPAVVKLVAPARDPGDALPLLETGSRLVRGGQPTTAFCMGTPGRPSRLLAATYGAAWSYAAIDEADAVAEGQWALRELVDVYRLRRWRPGWSCCGLIGHPIGHSLSPAILNAAFEAADLRFGYVPIAGPELEGALELAEGWGFRGLSVTMPFKEPAARRCVRLSPEAEAMGAVNTMVATDDGWEGHNTDGPAVVETLAARIPIEGARVVILGAGGAARAAAVALDRAGARVVVLNRTVDRARRVAELAGGEWGSLDRLPTIGRDVIVNATPVGMEPSTGGSRGGEAGAGRAAANGNAGGEDAAGGAEGTGPAASLSGSETSGPTPIPVEWLEGDEIVFDMVYRPLETPLLLAARRRGCTTVSGLEMLVRQAGRQFRLWTGAEAPLDEMDAAARAAI